jgi:hypothetical protein
LGCGQLSVGREAANRVVVESVMRGKGLAGVAA